MLLLCIFFQCNAPKEEKPNIIVYLADDLGYLDISVNGAEVVKTPVLQQLSEDGMTFRNAFVASPSCAPSRAALLTGLMPARNGAEVNHSFPEPGIPYLINSMKANGYQVFAFGKVAHYGGNKKCGFDYHMDQQVNLYENVTRFLDSAKVKGPICLFIGDRRPHVLWTKELGYHPDSVDLPAYFIDTKSTREHRSRYYTDITGMDAEMGKILGYLNDKFGSNTITLFTSDHGAQWPFGKWNLYDAGIRTPLIIKWPGKIAPGKETNAMVSWVDILPTLIDISGAEVPEGIDGRSFKDVLFGSKEKFREVIYTTHSGDERYNVYPIRSIRTDRYKLIINLVPDAYHTNHSDINRNDGAGLFWDSWDEKAAQDEEAAEIVKKYFVRPAREFYDLSMDPDEQNNLINDSEYQQVVEKLEEKLMQWIDVQGDQMKVYSKPHLIVNPKPTVNDLE